MRVQHNIAALNSYRNYSNNTGTVGKNLEKLSSGYKINRAGDDAAGLAISEKMRAQITGLETAQKNASDGVSLVQTAEGALTEIHSMLNRMVELADQSANGTYKDDVDRENLQKEVKSLQEEIDRIASATNFNGLNLLDGSMSNRATAKGQIGGKDYTFSVGAENPDFVTANTNADITIKHSSANDEVKATFDTDGKLTIELGSKTANDKTYSAGEISAAVRKAAKAAGGKIADAYKTFSMKGDDLKALKNSNGTAFNATAFAFVKNDNSLSLQIGDTSDDFNKLKVSIAGVDTASLGVDGIDISKQDGAQAAVDILKDAINYVSSVRGTLGASQNRLEHTLSNLSVTTENMTAAESRIRDVDVAKEMMSYTKNNILVQSAQAMLAQANQTPQGVLQLLQ